MQDLNMYTVANSANVGYEVRFFDNNAFTLSCNSYKTLDVAQRAFIKKRRFSGGSLTELIELHRLGKEVLLGAVGPLAAKETLLPLTTDSGGFICIRYGSQLVKY